MASTSIEKDKIIEQPVEQKSQAIIEHEPQKNSTNSNENAAVNVSSQKQLLGLAKKFSLDAAFLPESKQAPLEDRSYRRKKLDELRRQQNMEAIMLRAAQYCSDSAIADKADQDWFSRFACWLTRANF